MSLNLQSGLWHNINFLILSGMNLLRGITVLYALQIYPGNVMEFFKKLD
jgi:hypothetical protein